MNLRWCRLPMASLCWDDRRRWAVRFPHSRQHAMCCSIWNKLSLHKQTYSQSSWQRLSIKKVNVDPISKFSKNVPTVKYCQIKAYLPRPKVLQVKKEFKLTFVLDMMYKMELKLTGYRFNSKTKASKYLINWDYKNAQWNIQDLFVLPTHSTN